MTTAVPRPIVKSSFRVRQRTVTRSAIAGFVAATTTAINLLRAVNASRGPQATRMAALQPTAKSFFKAGRPTATRPADCGFVLVTIDRLWRQLNKTRDGRARNFSAPAF